MNKETTQMKKNAFATLVAVALVAGNAVAAVTADEAQQLKSTLTPLGAEKAGNADGSIPAWNGAYTKLQDGFKPGDVRQDPFADEKPILVINQGNVAQYADKLAEGIKALIAKHPDYKVSVFPTHRTAGAPQWVYDNTFENATRANTTNDGLNVEGAYGGIPFPIPKSGEEVMWNHLLSWQGESIVIPFRSYVVAANGKRVMVSEAVDHHEYPYYFKDGSLEKFKGEYWNILQEATSPPLRAGEMILIRDPVNMHGSGRQAWQYLTGQRRTRKAPSFEFDNPEFVGSGVANWDESFVFSGSLEKYDWKIVGKKEMYVPANNNRFAASKVEEAITPKFLNPDLVRFELRRVWVVEATLKQGKRHTVPTRRFYLDEDNWNAVLGDGWDAQGALTRVSFALPLLCPDLPGVIGKSQWGVYNLKTDTYLIHVAMNEMSAQYKTVARHAANYFTPENLSAMGSR